MNPYRKKRHAYLTEHPPAYCYKDTRSLLEIFYNLYTEIYPIDNSAIRSHYQKLGKYLQRFTPQEQDELFRVVYNIYAEQEQSAFLEGVRIGAQLALELHK